MYCENCGTFLEDHQEVCHVCGSKNPNVKVEPKVEEQLPVPPSQSPSRNSRIKHSLKKLAVSFFVAAAVFGILAFEVRFNYDGHRYVGGDAYNFIINGTYFAGYCAISAGMLVSGTISLVAGIAINEDK